MASALLSGVNPVNGINAAMISISVGGLTTSSQLITVITTNATDLAAGLAIAKAETWIRERAMITFQLSCRQ